MRAVSTLLLSCFLVSVSTDNGAPNFGSFFGKGLQTVGSNTFGAAKSIGGGLQTVGQPLGSAAEKIGSVSEGAAGAVGHELQKDIQTVKQPIDTTITYIGSSQCQNVQKIFGVSYEQMQGDSEPNLNDLELHYKTRDFNTIMNITQAPASLRQARQFDRDESVVLYFHGFTDDPSQISFSTLSQAYLDQDRMSVLALDASSLIRWLYIRAATYVRNIGEKMGAVLAAMVQHGQDPDRIHIVGHSLGSHIGGFTCKEFTRLTGKKIGRMTALDPAGPCFSHVDPELRLKRTDANYVDVIHTDAGVYGLKDAIGHKDYYPNSGSEQPNCILQTCSHSRAWELYSESVLNPDAFPAVRCKDWPAFRKGDCEWDKISYMGAASKPGDDGHYFLQTGINYPFGRGLNGTKFRNMDGILKNVVNLAG
ncbi:pancreatic lipase-related protein 2-like isoform X2 [Maniola jurtina]|uniref:pancreatic lipase-related protein 2-like isoform X2 n=1 Tax=Maniola jurtina TaxID=191418 RepID=UPI001E6876BD|nr:pancreatic lipase-related protein 2-like isoform X2 [Maniola jurtina]